MITMMVVVMVVISENSVTEIYYFHEYDTFKIKK